MPKFTHGPWSHDSLGDHTWIMDPEGNYIAELINSDDGGRFIRDERARKDNAILIAAAPQMYAALKILVSEIIKDYKDNGKAPSSMELTLALIEATEIISIPFLG